MDSPSGNDKKISRRKLLLTSAFVVGWGALVSTLYLGVAQTIRFFFPAVVFSPPSKFRIGLLKDFLNYAGDFNAYGIIFVDDRWKSKCRFFVVREQNVIYAISARCVHLGCTINWFGNLKIFQCPCHGSKYRSNGENFSGPAPRPLDRFHIELDINGEIIVDTSIVYEPARFHATEAFIQL